MSQEAAQPLEIPSDQAKLTGGVGCKDSVTHHRVSRFKIGGGETSDCTASESGCWKSVCTPSESGCWTNTAQTGGQVGLTKRASDIKGVTRSVCVVEKVFNILAPGSSRFFSTQHFPWMRNIQHMHL